MIFYPSAYSICWPTRLQRLMLQIFLRRVRVPFRVTVCTQPAVGVYWDSTPFDCFRWDFEVYIYISFTLFTCDCTLIYTLMYCVCQHTDPGMAQIHRGLTRLESGRYTLLLCRFQFSLGEQSIRDLQPLHSVGSKPFVFVQDIVILLHWIDTLVLNLREILTTAVLHQPFHFKGTPMQGSKSTREILCIFA